MPRCALPVSLAQASDRNMLSLHVCVCLQSRATAIDALQRALRDVPDKRQLLGGLQPFVEFLLTLVADPNFKIAISSMQILGDLVARVGQEIEPHLRQALACHLCVPLPRVGCLPGVHHAAGG